MKYDSTHDYKTPANTNWGSDSDIGRNGTGPAALKGRADVHDSMAVTESETTTIALADVGAAVPDETTVDVTRTSRGLKIDRREETFILEREADGFALTGVVGRDRRPERVPDWLVEVCGLFGVDEVTL